MKRGNIILIAIILIVVLILSILLIKNNNFNASSNNSTFIQYETEGKKETIISDNEFVDNEIDRLINSEEYSQMSDNEKKDACEKLLKELKAEEKIKDFFYSSSEMIFSFEYKNGVLGGIMIKQWDPYMN